MADKIETTDCPCNPESAALCEEHCPHYAHTAAEVRRLRAEVASLRLTLGGRTFSGQPVPDPIGCPMPGACAQVAEIERLRAILEGPPTDAMIRAALDEPQAGDENMYHRIWRAMAREAATHG